MSWVQAVGGLLLALGGWLAWIEAPLSGRIPTPCSRLVFLLAVLALVAAVRRSHVLAAMSGAATLAVCAYALGHLASADPRLWTLADENAQYRHIARFSLTQLPGNLGSDPELRGPVFVRTPQGQVRAAARFTGPGFWISVMAGLLLILSALAAVPHRAALWAGATGVVAASVWLALLAGPILGLIREEQARRSIALGQYPQAIQLCLRALQLSPQLRASVRLRLRIGQALLAQGIPNDPCARLYLAEQQQQAGRLEAARAELQLLATAAPSPIDTITSRRLAWLDVDAGLKHYRRHHLVSAVADWEAALRHDPAQAQAAFYLGRAYFDLGRYRDSITTCHLVLGNVHHPIVRSDTEANLGDSLTRLGKYSQARRAYEMASRLDSKDNFRVIKSLGGT